jgi:hypothetical protein
MKSGGARVDNEGTGRTANKGLKETARASRGQHTDRSATDKSLKGSQATAVQVARAGHSVPRKICAESSSTMQ